MKKILLLTNFLCLTVLLRAQVSVTVYTDDTDGGYLHTKFVIYSIDSTKVTDLIITGVLDATDFQFIRDGLPKLKTLNISAATIVGYTGIFGTNGGGLRSYPANQLPYCAFFNSKTHVGKHTLTSFQMPSTLTSIDDYAMQDCKSLASINIPSSVSTIGSYVFHLDTAMVSVYVPASVDSIGQGAFEACGGNIIVDGNNTKYSSLDGVLLNKNKTVLIECPNSKTSYTVPPTVVKIQSEGFASCSKLTTVQIPATVKNIGYSAFIGAGLVSVSLPASIIRIEENTFFYCFNLTSVNLPPSIKYMGFAAFAYCNNLSSFTIPISVDSIAPLCFGNCTALQDIILPNSIKSMGMGVFQGCSTLPAVQLPTSLTLIDSYLFSGCLALASVTIPPSVTSIGMGAFNECRSLKTVTIPASVNSIGNNAFKNCTGLISIYAEAGIPIALSADVFKGVNKTTCVLTVPKGAKALYQAADQWKDFIYINENQFTEIADPSTSVFKINLQNRHLIISEIPAGESVSIYNLGGQIVFRSNGFSEKVSVPLLAPGLYIVKIGNKTVKVMNS